MTNMDVELLPVIVVLTGLVFIIIGVFVGLAIPVLGMPAAGTVIVGMILFIIGVIIIYGSN